MALDIVSHMTQTANPVTLLASPLGEEGHKVAKGWTVVILIMILDVDVTAAGVSKGEAAFFLHDCMLLANTVISSGDACRYGADGKRFNDTLSREISRRNAARTMRGRFLHSATVEMTEGAGRLFCH